jgi:hypothetical protein
MVLSLGRAPAGGYPPRPRDRAAARREVQMSLRPGVFAPLLALVLAAARAPLAAEDEPPAAPGAPAQPTPEERTEKVLAALPAPSAAEAWSFDADLFVNGKPAGGATFRLDVAKEGEATLWRAVESVEFREGAVPVVKIDLEAVMDTRLTALYGKTVSTSKEGVVTFGWRRTPLGYGIERKEGEQDPQRVMLREATVLKASIAGLVRFLRAVPAEPAAYAVRVLVQDPNVGMTAEARIRDVLLEVQGLQRVILGQAEREVWVVRRLDPDKGERFLWFDAKDRTFLALVQPSNRLEFVRKGLGPTAEVLDWKRPPRTALAAALQAARGFAVADMDALERLLWWPGVTARMKADPANKDLDDAVLKARVLEQLKGSLTAQAPAVFIEGMLEGMAAELKLEDAGEGRVRATFPPAFRNLKLVLVPVEGVWYLAELPAKPKS